jgi:hypothetical protein
VAVHSSGDETARHLVGLDPDAHDGAEWSVFFNAMRGIEAKHMHPSVLERLRRLFAIRLVASPDSAPLSCI